MRTVEIFKSELRFRLLVHFGGQKNLCDSSLRRSGIYYADLLAIVIGRDIKNPSIE